MFANQAPLNPLSQLTHTEMSTPPSAKWLRAEAEAVQGGCGCGCSPGPWVLHSHLCEKGSPRSAAAPPIRKSITCRLPLEKGLELN